MKAKEIQEALAVLGYYDGPLNGDLTSANFRSDAKRYQADAELVVDGVVGPQTIRSLAAKSTLLRSCKLPKSFTHLLRWRCTSYYIGEVRRWPVKDLVPMRQPNGEVIARMPARAFAEAALEGTTQLLDGRLANVAAPAYTRVQDDTYDAVLAYAKAQGWVPQQPGYAGITTTANGERVTGARNFQIVKPGPLGFPVIRSKECTPFKTLAADLGVPSIARHDPAFKGKGGVVPAGTAVFILEYAGRTYVDAAGVTCTHDGWFVVNDTGGGIYGAHFDVFTGTFSLRAKGPITPRCAHIWFEGCEEKLGYDYTYGYSAS